jgi:hypothetical protein
MCSTVGQVRLTREEWLSVTSARFTTAPGAHHALVDLLSVHDAVCGGRLEVLVVDNVGVEGSVRIAEEPSHIAVLRSGRPREIFSVASIVAIPYSVF